MQKALNTKKEVIFTAVIFHVAMNHFLAFLLCVIYRKDNIMHKLKNSS